MPTKEASPAVLRPGLVIASVAIVTEVIATATATVIEAAVMTTTAVGANGTTTRATATAAATDTATAADTAGLPRLPWVVLLAELLARLLARLPGSRRPVPRAATLAMAATVPTAVLPA
jgi:hypothetical protein